MVELAFESMSTFQIIRALAVYKACAFSPLVNNATSILQISKRVLGGPLTYFCIRHSFFAHFCAGENGQDIRPVIAALESRGIHSILDYAAEADLDELKPTPGIVGRSFDVDIDEKECDENMNITLKSIEAAAPI